MNNLTEGKIRNLIENNFLNYFELLEKINNEPISEYILGTENYLRIDDIWDSIYYLNDNYENEIIINDKIEDVKKRLININDLKFILIQKIFIENNFNSYSNNLIDNILISAFYQKFILKKIELEKNSYLYSLFLILCEDLIYNNKINNNNLYLNDIQPNILVNLSNIKERLKCFINFLALNNLVNYNIIFWFFIIFNDLITGVKEDMFIGYLFDIDEKNKIEYCKRVIYFIDIRNEKSLNELKSSLNNENIEYDNYFFLRKKKININNFLKRYFSIDMFYLLLKFSPTKSINTLILNNNYDRFNDIDSNTLCKIYNSINILNSDEVLHLFINKKRCLNHIYLLNEYDLFNDEYYIKNISMLKYIYPSYVKKELINLLDEKLRPYFDINKSFKINLNYIANIKNNLKEIFLSIYPDKKDIILNYGNIKSERFTC